MNTVYVARELVTAASGEKVIHHPHYEYGLFPTHKAVTCALRPPGIKSCFPNRKSLHSEGLAVVTPRVRQRQPRSRREASQDPL